MSTAIDFAGIRADALSVLSDGGSTCTVKRSATDAYGDTGVYSTVASNVPCWVSNGLAADGKPFTESASTSRSVGVMGGVTIYFNNSQDIRLKDELVIGGQTYEVGTVHSESPLNFLLSVDATLRRVPA